MSTPDLVIIGGGVIGAATAYFAGKAGLRVVLYERRSGLGTLTTSASLAAFRAQFADAVNIAMMLEGISFFEQIRERTGQDVDIQLRQQGYLFATTTEDGYEQAAKRVDLQRSLGLTDVELWSGDEARKQFPFLAPDVTTATFRARDGWLSPHELTHAYARASGAEIHLDAPVEQIVVEKGRVRGIRAGGSLVPAPRVVIAAGPFSRNLARSVGIDLPISLLRRQRAAVKSSPLVPHSAPMVIDSDTGAHWHPDGRGAVLAWALPEEPGEPQDEVVPDWDFAAVVLDAVSRISPFWCKVAEGLRAADLDVRAGQYDMTPDARPLIGSHPAVEGLYLNCGYSGHGVMASAAGGRMLADLLTGRMSESDNPLRVTRFEEQAGKHSREEMVI